MDVGAKILNEVIMNMNGPLGKEEGEKGINTKDTYSITHVSFEDI
jgi:hypothetical protein